jgi:hypothetical protein
MDGLRGGHTEFAGEGRLTAHQRYALDERDAMIDRDGYNCWRCGCYLPGQRGARAHRIARTKINLNEYGPYVLDHRLNIKHSCERCNSYAMHFDSLQEREDMVAEIRADLTVRGYPITGEAYQARRQASKAEADRKKREQKLEERAREREEAKRNSRSAARIALDALNLRAKKYYQDNKEEIRQRGREQRRARGMPERMVWSDESAKEILKLHRRLANYIQNMKKKYGDKYQFSMTAHEVDMVERHRLTLETGIAAGKRIPYSERKKT